MDLKKQYPRGTFNIVSSFGVGNRYQIIDDIDHSIRLTFGCGACKRRSRRQVYVHAQDATELSVKLCLLKDIHKIG